MPRGRLAFIPGSIHEPMGRQKRRPTLARRPFALAHDLPLPAGVVMPARDITVSVGEQTNTLQGIADLIAAGHRARRQHALDGDHDASSQAGRGGGQSAPPQPPLQERSRAAERRISGAVGSGSQPRTRPRVARAARQAALMPALPPPTSGRSVTGWLDTATSIAPR